MLIRQAPTCSEDRPQWLPSWEAAAAGSFGVEAGGGGAAADGGGAMEGAAEGGAEEDAGAAAEW